MNKTLAIIVGLAAGLSALAQGNININNNFIATGATEKAFVLGGDFTPYKGLPVPKAVGRVEVLDNNGNIINGPADGTGKTFGADGLFFLGVTDIPGTAAGGNGSIVIRSWDSTTGSTFATATTKGFTIVTVGPLGGGAIPPPGLSTASNWTGMSIVGVPEPSTIALAGLGLVGLFYVARRK